MRILHVTNLISHHQLPLARQLAATVGEQNFRFAAMASPDPERLRLGWSSMAGDPWILRVGESEDEKRQFERWWDEADIVLCGERLFRRMSERLVRGKLCFYMSERWWKPPIGRARMLWPRFMQMAGEFRHVAAQPGFHYLPMGPFAIRDIATLTNVYGRNWQWGYFTDSPQEKVSVSLPAGSLKVLWVGRMLAWKRIDTLIEAVAALIAGGISIELTLVGDGPQRSQLKKLAAKKLLLNTFKFLDPVPSAQIPELMKRHHVYVLPSNAYEGWGAVINEAMGFGLAVVASNQAGAAAALIKDGVNGLLFHPGDWRKLATCLQRLAGSIDFRNILVDKAQKTIIDLWSPQVAAERLLVASDALLSGGRVPDYSEGPMASAQKWLKALAP